MIGLALQGGGARGSYQIGAYLALKKAHIKFDGVCGTSIGAFNGAMIASGKERELLKFWENISVGEILGFNPKYVAKRLENEHDLDYLKLKFENFIEIIKTRGIPTEGLKEVLRTNVDKEALMNSKIDYGICTVRLPHLKPLYIFKEEMNKEKLDDYILASCYLPFFKMEKKIDSHYYIDGGFADNTPVNMLIEKGYKKIYVIELNPLINRKRKPAKKVEIIKITPRRNLGGVLIYDNEQLKENIKMGYYDALRVVKNLDGYYYCFKNKKEWVYNWLTRKIDKKTLERVMGFFNAKTKKEVVIKALEYRMKREEMDYYKVYNPLRIVKNLQKNSTKKHFVDEFIRQLKFL